MKKVKLLFLIVLIVITCTGCTIEYNINVSKENIEEIINVNDYITSTRTQEDILNHYNTWYPTFVNFISDGESIEIEDFSEKVEGIEYHEKKINQINNGYNYKYNYTYSIEDYYDSYALANAFLETTVHEGDNNLVIKTSKENLLCQYSYFDSLKVNITINPEVYKLNYTNTSNINNNTYTWTLDRNNCNESQILLTLDTIGNQDNNDNEIINNQNNNSNKNQSDYTIYIFFGILILLIIIGYFIFNKIKEKNSNFNEDDD